MYMVNEAQATNTQEKKSIKDVFVFVSRPFRFIFNEIGTMLVAAGEGVGVILSPFRKVHFTVKTKTGASINIDIGATVDAISAASAAAKQTKEDVNGIEYNSNLPLEKKLALYLENLYNAIPAVQQRNKIKEESLTPLVLDPAVDGVKTAEKQVYKYYVKDKKGKYITGYFPAFSRMDVYSYLNDEGYVIYEISTDKQIAFLHGGMLSSKSKMKTKDLVFWLTQLCTYLKAGIPLTDSVRVLAQQDSRTKYKALYQSMVYELTMGATFSDTLERQGSCFPALLVNMIKSAELAGTIEETLDQMAQYYQEIEDNRRAIISAVAYPCVVLVFAIGIVIFMLSYIVPKFVDVYESMGAALNPVTVITLKISAFITTKWMYVVSIVVVLVVSYIVCFRKIKAFRKTMQGFYMRFPALGNIIVYKEVGMFSRTFASLLKNNVLISDSIDVLSKITQNELYKDLMINTVNSLVKGNKMSETFKDNWIIPDIAYFMIVTGESTGDLAAMLDKVADFYTKQQKNSVAMIKTFIEPVMIIFLAVSVGFILVAILVPMFGIYSTVA
jgi:type IV pilus assembly protein PilC